MGKARTAYKILVGKPKGKGPIERSIYRLEDKVKLDST
jgi:hypothetical protein